MNSEQKESKAYWAIPEEEVLLNLQVTRDGLSDSDAKDRLVEFGFNELPSSSRTSRLRIAASQFTSPIIVVLMLAGIITIFVDDIAGSIFIWLAVIVNAGLGFYQEDKAESSLEGLQRFIKEQARVIRDGVEKEVDAREIVPGDIIRLFPGMRIPADCRILEVSDLSVNESILTGEAMPVTHKGVRPVAVETMLGDRYSMLFAGTFLDGGIALGVVVSTGVRTELGKIAKAVNSARSEKTPMQMALNKFTVRASLGLGIVTVLVWVIGVLLGHDSLEMFLVSVALAVSAVPEGLPVAMTVILAVGVTRLANKKGVVRKLLAAETLGSTTLILTDKTGTLTQAKMKLVDIISDFSKEEVLEAALLNTDVLVENPKDDPKQWRIIGRPLEAALVLAGAEYKVVLDDVRTKFSVLEVEPFDSKKKFSAVRLQHGSVKQWNYLGAPEVLLAMTEMEVGEKRGVLKKVEELAFAGHRVLGVARDKKFIGLIVFRDPARPGVKDALAAAMSAGVRTVIVTGDHAGTAVALAKEVGLAVPEGAVMTGAELREFSNADLHKVLSKMVVFARMSPEDKFRLAMQYKLAGEVVAMTGDGVNDAPALKNADVGIALGSGTEIAKGSADLVMLDDNFEIIVSAIEEGRRILNNLKKVLVYFFCNSLSGILLVGGSLLMGLPIPFGALQILWVNFFTDSFPASSFAFEDGHNYLKDSPPQLQGKLFDKQMKLLVLVCGPIITVLLFGLYIYLLGSGYPQAEVKTFVFASFSAYTLFLAFSIRNLDRSIFHYKLFDNPYLIASSIFGIILTAVGVYVPLFQRLFGTVSLSLGWIAGVVAFGFVSVAIFEAGKYFFRRDKKK